MHKRVFKKFRLNISAVIFNFCYVIFCIVFERLGIISQKGLGSLAERRYNNFLNSVLFLNFQIDYLIKYQ